MPFIYYLMIVVSSSGSVTISPPFSTEYACDDAKAAVLAGAELLKERGNTITPFVVGCKRVTPKEERPS